jgi:hypothetical protein
MYYQVLEARVKALIEGRFSSAEETASVLGVSSSRTRTLINLTRSNSPYLARVSRAGPRKQAVKKASKKRAA